MSERWRVSKMSDGRWAAMPIPESGSWINDAFIVAFRAVLFNTHADAMRYAIRKAREGGAK